MAGAGLALQAVDRLEVLVLVDNAIDPLSTNPPGIRAELASLLAAGMTVWSGAAGCVGQHGLSLLVTVHAGDKRRRLLFDFGPDGATLRRNLDRLGIRLADVDAYVLSHGHWDHAGGLPAALAARGPGAHPVAVHLHPGMFFRRGVRLPDGNVVPFADVPSQAEVALAGGTPRLAATPQLLLDGLALLSGEIPRRTPYEAGFPNHVREQDGQWHPDPLLLDERFLAIHVRGHGLVVFTACSHAGVVNVLRHACELVPGVPLHAVLGGLHLAGPAPEAIIADTVRDVAALAPRMVAPGHCTGWRATHALTTALPAGGVVPLATGKQLTWPAPAVM